MFDFSSKHPETSVPRGADSTVIAGEPSPVPEAQSGLGSGLAVFAVVLAAGVVAGCVSVLGGEVIMNYYRQDLLPRLSAIPIPEDMRRFRAARIHSPALSFAILGGLLGLVMGLAGGWLGLSIGRGARAAMIGLVLGAAVTGAVCFFGATKFFAVYDQQANELLLPLLLHGAVWLTVGATSGLALGLGLGGGRWQTTVGGGVAGAVVATICYEISGALFLTMSRTDLPLSATLESRAMAQMLVAVLTAAGMTLALRMSTAQAVK